jgi:hypothetical protein
MNAVFCCYVPWTGDGTGSNKLCILFLESRGDVGRFETAESRIGTALFGSHDTQHTASTFSYIIHVSFVRNPPEGGHCRPTTDVRK